MSDISDGMYIVRSVANKSLSLNVKGAADGNGVNIQLWSVNKLQDGGYCAVQTKSEDSSTEVSDDFTGDGATTIFSLTSRAISNTIAVTVDGVTTTDYVIDHIYQNSDVITRITFTSAPASGAAVNVKYYTGKEWQLLSFPATGKIASVAVGSGTGGGGIPGRSDNIYQYEIRGGGLGGGEQRWFFEDTGGTTTFDGKTYHTYRIWMYVTIFGGSYTPMLVECKGHGTPSKGTNVQIYVNDGETDQLWFFEPIDSIFPGTYKVVTRRNAANSMYVNGASKSAGARIGVQPYTGEQNQTWYITPPDGGRIQLRPIHSFGDFATFASSTATIRDQCCQDGHSASATDHWWIPYPIPGKTLMVDGSSYQCFELSIQAGVGDLVADIPSGDIKNWLQIYTANGSDAQLWAFVPVDAIDQTLPTPSDIGVQIDGTDYHGGTAIWDSESPIFPIWTCTGTKFQARYRTRKIGISDTGTESYPDGWTEWKSLADGMSANDGWGTAWLPNQTFTTPGDVKASIFSIHDTFTGDGESTVFSLSANAVTATMVVKIDGVETDAYTVDYVDETTNISSRITFDSAPASDSAITVDYKTGALVVNPLNTDYPATDIEVEVRYFTNEWGEFNLPAHGSSSSATVRVYNPMQVTVTGIRRIGEGLEVSFTSDWGVGATTARVPALTTDNATLIDAVTESGKYSGGDTIVVPWGNIDQFVAIDDEVTVTLELTTSLGVAGVTTYTGAAVDGGDQGVTPTYEATDHATYTVTVPHPTGESTKVYFLQNGVRPMEVKPSSKGSASDIYDLMVPLNAEGHYEVIVSGFAVGMLTLPAIASHFSVWTFGDGDWAVLDWGYGKNPTQEDNQEVDTDEYQLTGREYHAYRKRSSMTRDLSMTGCFVESMPEHGSREAMMRLLKAGHAIYRNVRGEVHNVYISNISLPLNDTRYTEVSVTQYAETR